MMTEWRRIPLDELARFGIVGGLSTALYFALLAVLWRLLGLPLPVAAALAYGLGMMLNYVLQRSWTFRSNRSHRLAVPIFAFIHGIGLSLNVIVLSALVDGLGWSFIVGQSAALVLVFAWSYLIQKFFVFNSSGPSASSRQKRCHGRIETATSRQGMGSEHHASRTASDHLGFALPCEEGQVDRSPERRETTMTTNNAEADHAGFLGPILRALFFILLITLLFSGKGALQDTHWDAPIYLLNGKELASTQLLDDYARHASEIASRLPEFKAGVDTYTPYWGFMRLGNIMVLGAVTALAGHDVGAIRVAFLLYTAMLATALVLAAYLGIRIVRQLAPEIPRRALVPAAILSTGLYLISDSYRHVSGTFVAEVPDLLLLTSGALLLTLAVAQRRIALVLASGVFGFLIYLVKMDGIWVWISFVLSYAVVLFVFARKTFWWPAFLVTGLLALLLYGVYSWWFWPLTDPRLVIVFAQVLNPDSTNSVATIKLWVVAGGLLWLGLAVAMMRAWRNPVFWLAMGWLLLTSLPYAGAFLNNGPAQVRMFVMIMPPLMILSTLGLATLLARAPRPRLMGYAALLLAIILPLAALSHAETYQRIRGLPGAWRLQSLKTFLSPPPYERQFYPVEELDRINTYLSDGSQAELVVRDDKIREEYINILAFLGKTNPRSTVNEYFSLGTYRGICNPANIHLALERPMFCEAPPAPETLAPLGGRLSVLCIQPHGKASDSHRHPDASIVFSTPNLALRAHSFISER